MHGFNFILLIILSGVSESYFHVYMLDVPKQRLWKHELGGWVRLVVSRWEQLPAGSHSNCSKMVLPLQEWSIIAVQPVFFSLYLRAFSRSSSSGNSCHVWCKCHDVSGSQFLVLSVQMWLYSCPLFCIAGEAMNIKEGVECTTY